MPAKRFSIYQIACGFLIRALRPFSVPMELLLHREVGERYLGFSGFLGLGVLIAWAILAPHSQMAPIVILMLVFLARTFMYDVARQNRREFGGPPRHSRYPGRPVWGLLHEKFDEDKLRQAEGALVIVAGCCIKPANHALGTYLLLAGAAMLAVLDLRERIARDRLLDRQDAELEGGEPQATAEQQGDDERAVAVPNPVDPEGNLIDPPAMPRQPAQLAHSSSDSHETDAVEE